MALYDKFTSIKNPGRKVQVESAIRDGIGRIIADELDSRLELITEDILVKDAPLVFIYNERYFCYKTPMFNNRVGMTMMDSHGYYYLVGTIKNKYLSEILVEENYNQFIRNVEVDSTPLEAQDGTVNIDLSGKVDKSTVPNILYGTDDSGMQEIWNFGVDLNPDYIPMRDSQAQIWVPLTPTNNYHATSKKYVDDLVQAIKKNSFTEVDITTYPTLNDFLASTGEEGYMYLYPVDTSDLSKGYKQYIWENNTWIYMGDTQLNLTNYVTLDTDQTIDGEKTFAEVVKHSKKTQYVNSSNVGFGIRPATDNSGYIEIVDNNNSVVYGIDNNFWSNNSSNLGKSTKQWKDLYLGGIAYIGSGSQITQSSDGSLQITLSGDGKSLKPSWDGHYNLGSSSYRWKDGYFSGQVYAQNTFNVINASEIVNNTLTQAQYYLITNGKPTLIWGTLLGFREILLQPGNINSGVYYYAIAIANDESSFNIHTRVFKLDLSTKVISFPEDLIIDIQNINSINGKTIPFYPSNTGTFAFKQVNGTLSWQQEWYGTQAEYDALGTYDSNTLYYIEEE